MKKSGAVAAVMAGIVLETMTPAAQAQSMTNVTLYGIVDTLIDISNQGKGTLVREMSGGPFGSRWGLKGSEDLGGGWKTIFTLESGFGANNGASQQGGLLFGRQAFVGITGAPGTLTFGRQYSPEFWAFSRNDAFELGLAGGLSNISRTLPNGTVAGLLNAYLVTSRTNNSAYYKSPNLYGLTVDAMYAFGGVAGSLKEGSTISVGANYTLASLALNGGYLRNVTADGAGDLIAWTVGGSYTIGSAQVFLAYTKDTDTSANTPAKAAPKVQFSLANLGIKYQITPFLFAAAQVTHIVNTSDGLAASQNAYAEAVSLTYQLSKRTAVYTAYGQVQNKNGSTYSLGGALYFGGATAPGATGRTFQVGMRTLF
ncbi:UNVERIFIED_ORG: putative porin [Burkholderia sp. CF145]|jgi:predicted porin